jgi:hypothetical protein
MDEYLRDAAGNLVPAASANDSTLQEEYINTRYTATTVSIGKYM